MKYSIYNDYELLYLIEEGNELAFNIMFSKYEKYIWKIVFMYYPYNHKTEDLVQEGRLVLYRCISTYNPLLQVSFFSYFTICLKRYIFKEIKKTYYENQVELNDNILDLEEGNNRLPFLFSLLDKKEKEIYDWVFVFDNSISSYANNQNKTLYKTNIEYLKLLTKIKKNYGL